MRPVRELLMFTVEQLSQVKYAVVYSSLGSLFGAVLINASATVNVWLQANMDYVTVALFSVGVAQVLGTLAHSRLYKNDFDWGKNIIGFSIMLSMVVIVGLLFEGLAHLTKEENLIYIYLKMVGRIMVIIYPVRSALRNVYIITSGAFPPIAIIGKMDRFNENLNLNEFRDNNNDADNTPQL